MKFLIDENIRLEVAEFLRTRAHDVKRISSGMKNGQVIQTALREKRTLVTSDVHFSNILMYPPHKYCGIIRLKIHPPSAEKEVTAIRLLLLKFKSSADFDGKLFVLEESDFRVRK